LTSAKVALKNGKSFLAQIYAQVELLAGLRFTG